MFGYAHAGPPPTRTIDVDVHQTKAPFGTRPNASGVWTGSELIVWGGYQLAATSVGMVPATGAAYDPLADRWRMIADGPLAPRAKHLAVWTGSEMIVWGGQRTGGAQPPDGAAYDAERDAWRPIAPAPIPWGTSPTSVWTGSEWVIAVVKSRANQIRMAAYNPQLDAWRRLPSIDQASSSGLHLAWTGEELVITSWMTGMYRLASNSPLVAALRDVACCPRSRLTLSGPA